MPPCGYRPEAISGLERFLADNLEYFRALYEPKGLSPLEAVEVERLEIAAIRSGRRGGPWATTTVMLNERFYNALAQRELSRWEDVMREGRLIIRDVALELGSLSHDGAVAA
jgi:hypothetical protein